jgi:Putative transmembrane protein (Alph_Pro_TM)
MRRTFIGLCFFLPGLIAFGLWGSPGWGSTEAIKCLPPCLEKTLFSEKFHVVTITGPAPAGADIILKVVSPNREFKLNRSGKGLGFVWLPVGHAEVRNLPGMCVLLSSARVKEILTEEEQKAAGLTYDFQEIYQQAEIRHKESLKTEEAASLNREYLSGLIRILREAGLYRLQEGAVKITRGQFEAQLIHPSEAPLGEYRILCYAVKDGKARLFGEQNLLVKSTGLAEWLSRQAQENAGAYGILAALIAVGVGLFVGIIFKRGGGH